MAYSDAGYALTKHFEGCCLRAYQDTGGVWTQGYGNTHGVVPFTTITQAKADADLKANLQVAIAAVNKLVKVALTQSQFDALVDFVFNCGAELFSRSTLLKLVNAGRMDAAAGEFGRWIYDNGKPLPGLIKRRQAEAKLFRGQAWTS